MSGVPNTAGHFHITRSIRLVDQTAAVHDAGYRHDIGVLAATVRDNSADETLQEIARSYRVTQRRSAVVGVILLFTLG